MTKSDVGFANGNRAVVARAPRVADPAAILGVLGLRAEGPVVLLSGGAEGLDGELAPRLAQLFGRGVVRAAAATSALVLDGGTDAGVMALMGQAVADRGQAVPLVGVAPAGRVSAQPEAQADRAALEPNHSHFVLVDGDAWGQETDALCALAAAAAGDRPVVTIVVGGGSVARQEVLRSVRRGWPVVVLAGSGRLADEIAESVAHPPAFIADAALAEIVADGDFHVVKVTDPPLELERRLTGLLGGDPVLRSAWERFSLYDHNAKRHQLTFNGLQILILALGVGGTVLALFQTQLKLGGGSTDDPEPLTLHWLLKYSIIVIPVLVSVLIAITNRFKEGNKWVLLRGAAEAIKRQIFRYRVRAANYVDDDVPGASRPEVLAQRIEDISRRLFQTEVNLSSLHAHKGPIPPVMTGAGSGDDGLRLLTGEQYVHFRLGDQLSYMMQKTRGLDKQLYRIQWAILLAGGVGTLLAAFHHELWVAMTTALATAATTYLGYQQIESSMVKYNQAATDLYNVKSWWLALSPDQRADPKNVDKLVDHAEMVLENVLTGWVQQMQNALSALRDQEDQQTKGSAAPARTAVAPPVVVDARAAPAKLPPGTLDPYGNAPAAPRPVAIEPQTERVVATPKPPGS